MFLSTWTPHPLLIIIGPIHLFWYGLLLAVGALVGFFIILRLGKQAQFSPTFLTDLFVFLVIGGFLGGRIYHVLNEWGYYSAHPGDIIKIWNGGLAIHGAMIVGLVVMWLMARRHKKNPWLLADILTIGLAFGQAIGRWGNYFNQELFGRPTNLPWKILISAPYRPANSLQQAFYHPAFLYESLGCLLLGGMLWFMIAHRNGSFRFLRPWQMPGTIALTYFILYSVLRIGVESIRIDRVPIIAGIRLPLLTSCVIIIVAVAIWILRIVHARAHAQPNRPQTQ